MIASVPDLCILFTFLNGEILPKNPFYSKQIIYVYTILVQIKISSIYSNMIIGHHDNHNHFCSQQSRHLRM